MQTKDVLGEQPCSLQGRGKFGQSHKMGSFGETVNYGKNYSVTC